MFGRAAVRDFFSTATSLMAHNWALKIPAWHLRRGKFVHRSTNRYNCHIVSGIRLLDALLNTLKEEQIILLSPKTIIPALALHHQRWTARAEEWRRLGLGPFGLPAGLSLNGLGPAGLNLGALEMGGRGAGGLGAAEASPGHGSDHLVEVDDFGSNPGALRMFKYVPAQLPKQPALVVVLHGCAQTAASYDLGVGWSTLADRYGFALVLPQQQRGNNPNCCFNWFLPDDTTRGSGEALSIRQMIDVMTVTHGVDPARVFVTGLSAGGGMTSVMLATYPEVFAGGAIIAGLPYGAAATVNEALESMFAPRPRPAREWGDLVRAASRHRGPWPRISIWHGSADTVVRPDNAVEIAKQWTDVHGLGPTPALTEKVDGYPRQVWRDRNGREIIESYTIAGMAHGAPLATGPADRHCGVPGAFVLDVGISSSYHIARFWGLTATADAAGKPRPLSKWLSGWFKRLMPGRKR
jgi:poly(hydroxyalkanoate) depolymerase family esterase